MNKENASKLWKIIQETGDYLLGQLPEHPNHPKGRNPYAHVALSIKEKFNLSYKDIPSFERERIGGFKKVNALKDGFLILISIISHLFLKNK